VAEWQEDDPGAQRDPLAHGCERRQRDDDVEDRVPVGDVVAGPDRGVAELLGADGDLAEDGGIRNAADELAAALNPEGDAQRRTSRQARS
jgi:hypothetical protein